MTFRSCSISVRARFGADDSPVPRLVSPTANQLKQPFELLTGRCSGNSKAKPTPNLRVALYDSAQQEVRAFEDTRVSTLTAVNGTGPIYLRGEL